MTTFIEEPSVTVVEVAKRAGQTLDEVQAEAAVLNLYVGENWAHEPALAARDAYALVDGSARRNLEHENAWQSHTVALQQWQDERENVRRRAFDEAWKAAVRAGHNDGPATDMGHAAGREGCDRGVF
jgi:hypothetical protein